MKRYQRKLTGKELAQNFKKQTGQDSPAENKTYTCKKVARIRPVAEYEPMGGAIVAYIGTEAPDAKHKQLPPSGERTFGVPDELIVRMQQLGSKDGKIPAGDYPVHIFILCDDDSQLEILNARFQKVADEKGFNFDPSLVHLIPWDADTYWTRDYCPWWVKYKDEDCVEEEATYAISKHIYTSLGGGSVGMIEGAEEVNPREGSGIFRCNDDYGAVRISDFFNGPIRKRNNASWSDGRKLPQIKTHRWFFSGLLNVGGNYMATSKGVLASSYLVATQNELPEDMDPENPTTVELDERMEYIMEQTNRFLGANTYHVLADPTGTYIGHIDCWGKFLADDKVLIGRTLDKKVNKGLDTIAEYFKQHGFQVYRVTAPDIYAPTEDEPASTAPYTNSLILNKHVYVPLCGEKSYDEAALKAYQDALGEEYTVEGIIGKPETPWLGTDALHCRTNAVPKTIVDRWLKSTQPAYIGKMDEKKAHKKYRGDWLPDDRTKTVTYVNRLIAELKANKADGMNALGRTEFVHPEAAEFRNTVINSPRLRAIAEQMVEEGYAYDPKDPTGKPEIHNLETMFLLIDLIMGKAPEYMQPDEQGRGLIGFPINAVLDWCMGTQAGYEFFLDPEVNACLEKILKAWCNFLSGPKSAYVLNSSETGWLCDAARKELSLDDFVCDPRKKHYGFHSWNDFFTRKFKEGKRPVEAPDDPYIINNACESAPYRIAADVQTNTKFWLKGQPYSIEYMLDHSRYTSHFIGGTVYQAFLSATHYHCWHAPVSGTIKEVKQIKGTYYAEVNMYPYDDAGPNESQAYITHVAARACIMIEADNKDIGMVAFLPVGMSEVSSCNVAVKEGDRVKKGDYLGCFLFGGSTHCLIFEKDVIDSFAAGAIPAPDFNDSALMRVGTRLATAKKKTDRGGM